MAAFRTLNYQWRVSFHKIRKWPTSLEESLIEVRVIYAVAGEAGQPIHEPRSVIPFRRNQSRKAETVVLKWLITEGRNPEHRGLRT